jgi:signal peptidase I
MTNKLLIKIRDLNIKEHKITSYFYITFFIVAIFIVLLVFFRVFLFSTFRVPSSSMEPEIKSGEYVLVNKLIPGARIFKNFDFLKNNTRPQIWRLKGFRCVKRNDVLVFNFPYSNRAKLGLDINVYYVKRCIAIPGDSFYIDNGIYRVKKCNDSLGNVKNQKRMSLSREADFLPAVYNCFPKKSSYNWNLKFFGPFYIPRKADHLAIDTLNIKLYENLIEYETNGRIKIKNRHVYLNDRIIQYYTFQTNYYFMSGDNVFNSRDSRYWGLLPEDNIIGKVALVWKL